MKEQIDKPSIFDFLDMVQFLQAHYQWRKAIQKTFSYTEWCAELNLGSKTLLRFILQRKRRISEKTALVLKSNLRLKNDESDYFDNLLCYSQAATESQRAAFGSKLNRIQRSQYKQTEINPELAAKDVFGPIVLTLLTFKDFSATVENISEILNVEPTRIQKLMDDLCESNLIFKNETNAYILSVESFRIKDNAHQDSLLQFHNYWLSRSKEALKLDFKTRRFRSLKFALSDQEFIEAVDRINEFAMTILNQFHKKDLQGRRLYMIENILFPISNRLEVVDQNENLSHHETLTKQHLSNNLCK